jgi:hypothetical protein
VQKVPRSKTAALIGSLTSYSLSVNEETLKIRFCVPQQTGNESTVIDSGIIVDVIVKEWDDLRVLKIARSVEIEVIKDGRIRIIAVVLSSTLSQLSSQSHVSPRGPWIKPCNSETKG